MEICFWIVSIVYLIVYAVFAAKNGDFKKTIFRTALIGIVLLFCLHITGRYFGFMIPLNLYTISFSALTGLPGVVLVSLINFLFI